MLFKTAEQIVQPYRKTGILQPGGEGSLDVSQSRLHVVHFAGVYLAPVWEEIPGRIRIQRRIGSQDSLNQSVFIGEKGYQRPPLILPADSRRETVPELIRGVHSLEDGGDAHFGRLPVIEGGGRKDLHQIAHSHLKKFRAQPVNCHVQWLAWGGRSCRPVPFNHP